MWHFCLEPLLRLSEPSVGFNGVEAGTGLASPVRAVESRKGRRWPCTSGVSTNHGWTLSLPRMPYARVPLGTLTIPNRQIKMCPCSVTLAKPLPLSVPHPLSHEWKLAQLQPSQDGLLALSECSSGCWGPCSADTSCHWLLPPTARQDQEMMGKVVY